MPAGALLGVGAAAYIRLIGWLSHHRVRGIAAPLGAYAMAGAAATIGCAMQAPITGLVMVLELTHSGFALVTSMVMATVAATSVVRYLDGYSTYSARLPARPSASP